MVKIFFTWVMYEWVRLIVECCALTKVLGRLRMVWGALKMLRLSVFNSIGFEYAVVTTCPQLTEVWKIELNVLLDSISKSVWWHILMCTFILVLVWWKSLLNLSKHFSYALPAGVTFQSYTFCSQSVFMCFMCIFWNTTTIILLCSFSVH
jgi:hypothetical protein